MSDELSARDQAKELLLDMYHDLQGHDIDITLVVDLIIEATIAELVNRAHKIANLVENIER